MPNEAEAPNTTYAPIPELTGELSPTANKHNVLVVTLLSLIIVGAGQCYNRQPGKGVAFFVATIGMVFVENALHLIQVIGPGISLVILIAAIVDARTIAQKIHAGQSVGKWEFF